MLSFSRSSAHLDLRQNLGFLEIRIQYNPLVLSIFLELRNHELFITPAIVSIAPSTFVRTCLAPLARCKQIIGLRWIKARVLQG